MRRATPIRWGDAGAGSKLRDDETDTADDVVGWRFVRFERKKLNREGKREWAEDEPSIVEFDKTEDEAGTATDSILAPFQRHLHKSSSRLNSLRETLPCLRARI